MEMLRRTNRPTERAVADPYERASRRPQSHPMSSFWYLASGKCSQEAPSDYCAKRPNGIGDVWLSTTCAADASWLSSRVSPATTPVTCATAQMMTFDRLYTVYRPSSSKGKGRDAIRGRGTRRKDEDGKRNGPLSGIGTVTFSRRPGNRAQNAGSGIHTWRWLARFRRR